MMFIVKYMVKLFHKIEKKREGERKRFKIQNCNVEM